MTKLQIHTLADINTVAKEFLNSTKDFTVFAFYGNMGVGKTTFIKALCSQLQVKDSVASPTFAIINEYHTSSQSKIFHFDLYRLKNLEELLQIGAEDYFYSGNICLIEWPEVAESILPLNYLAVSIIENESGIREISW